MNSQPRATADTDAADDAAFMAAVRHHQAGEIVAAELGYRTVLTRQPERADVLFNLAAALRQQNRLDEAAESYRQTVALQPDYAEAHYNLGNTLMALGRCGDAVAAYRAAIAARPGFAAAYGNLGIALRMQNALEDAAAAFRQAATLMPDNAEAHVNLGAALAALGQHDEAAAAYREAVRRRPDLATAHYDLGTVLEAVGRPSEAAAAYRAALAADPRLVEARSNLGNILNAQGHRDAALACLREALALDPARPAMHYNLGNALKDAGALDEAVTAYRAAIKLKPDHADAHGNLAIVFMEQGRIEEADAAFRRALDLAPGHAGIRSNWLFCQNYRTDIAADAAFVMHRTFEAQHGRPAAHAVHGHDRTPGRRLKIGYVSPDFRMHSVAYFVEPLLAAHDRQAVEVTCYADVAKPDQVTARLQTLADRWVPASGLSDDELAARIRQDGIDILVDCAGHTAHNRLQVFARQPAPVQVNWLGYPNTTGLNAIGYRLVDGVTDPAGVADEVASERLIRLPGGFLCYAGAADAPEPVPPPCLMRGHVTFGSFNNPAKLSPATLDAWGALLTRVPGARLLLKGKPFADAATRALYLSRLTARGIEAERVELIGWTGTSAHHLSLYARVDVALDPFPYNGTTTTCEALWMGVPVVTLRGDRHAGRVGASLLTRIGAAEWIAESAADYVARAAQLAADRQQLGALRRCLRARVAASPLCDRAAFAGNVEAAYRQMWQAWCETGPAVTG